MKQSQKKWQKWHNMPTNENAKIEFVWDHRTKIVFSVIPERKKYYVTDPVKKKNYEKQGKRTGHDREQVH
jgi:hypothetical protein